MHFLFNPTAEDWSRWGIAAAIFAGFILLAFASRFILTRVINIFTRKTRTSLDDLLIKALTPPAIIAIIIAGAAVALARLPELDPYIETVHKVFTFVYILIAAVAVVRVVHALLSWYGAEVASKTESDFDDRLIPILQRVSSIVIYAIALMVLLARMGWDISPILAGLGIGGLAVALALQSTLSNFLAGTYVITDSVIRKGHYIMLDSGQEGFVEDIGWRTTKIRTWQGNLVIFPNSRLADAIVTDFEKPDAALSFIVECGVSYESDLNRVEKIAVDVAKKLLAEHPAGVKNFEPVVRFKAYGDSNIIFTIVMRGIDRASQFILKHEYIKLMNARFQQEGIEINYPVRKLLYEDQKPPNPR